MVKLPLEAATVVAVVVAAVAGTVGARPVQEHQGTVAAVVVTFAVLHPAQGTSYWGQQTEGNTVDEDLIAAVVAAVVAVAAAGYLPAKLLQPPPSLAAAAEFAFGLPAFCALPQREPAPYVCNLAGDTKIT